MANQEEVVKEYRQQAHESRDLQEVARVLRGHYGKNVRAAEVSRRLSTAREVLAQASLDPPEDDAELFKLITLALARPAKPDASKGPAEDSLAALVLKVAHSFQPGREFNFEELAWACWNGPFQVSFSLWGFTDTFDSRKVATVLFGARGLVQRGFLTKLPSGLYTVPRKGGEDATTA